MEKTFILKQNSEEIRKKIENAGIGVCICASFNNSCWLDYSTIVHNGVHGVGSFDKEEVNSQEEELSRFLSECEYPVFCDNVEEFINCIKQTSSYKDNLKI